MSRPDPPTREAAGRNVRLAAICLVVFAGMVGAAFAAVPLYRAFCQATGFAGTVRRASAAPTVVSARTVVVAFDTNTRGLPWGFHPDQASQTVHPGATNLAFFSVTNDGDAPVTGRAVYNVTPESAGAYFSKLECFCFKNQTLAAHASAHFPVVYFVDPRFGTDDDTRGIKQITLSYTFYPAAPLANAARGDSTRPGGVRASGPNG